MMKNGIGRLGLLFEFCLTSRLATKVIFGRGQRLALKQNGRGVLVIVFF